MKAKSNTHNNIKHVFVCPAMMDASMRYVQPVMSLDAAHMKSQWKGTLHVASVKTARDEIHLVVFAIMTDNESAAGWNGF